mgnify:FL=1
MCGVSWPTISYFIISHLVNAKNMNMSQQWMCMFISKIYVTCAYFIYVCLSRDSLIQCESTHVYELPDWLLVWGREHVSHGEDVYNSKPWKMWFKYEMKIPTQREHIPKYSYFKLDHFSFTRYLENQICYKRSVDTRYLRCTFTMHIQNYQRVEMNHCNLT